MSKQVLRSGTSIGANVREAESAQSKADSVSKMAIALKGRIVDWHAIKGKEYGEMDHLTWVTMTKDGPVVANLTLDGILPGDYLTQRNTLSEEQLIPKDEPDDSVVVERFKKMKAEIEAKKGKKK